MHLFFFYDVHVSFLFPFDMHLVYWLKVQSRSNEPKTMLDNHQKFCKIIILLDMFLWCHFNALVIMGNCTK